MPDYSVLYPQRFMAKEALAAPKVIRIKKVTVTVLEGEKGAENKVVVAYSSADGNGEIVWCKTNAALTSFALGTRDTDQWIERLITIYNNPNVDLGGKKVGGIRVFGSPEMKEPLTVEVKRPRRKKGEMYKLVPTDSKGAPRTGANTPRAAEKPSAPPDVADELPPPEYLERVEAEVA